MVAMAPRSKPLEPHPAANLFPMMSEEEIEALSRDILANEQQVPIVLYKGKILDGRNRAEACAMAGVEPKTVEWDGKGGSPALYVVSLNVHRRHLTQSQKAFIALELEALLAEEAAQRKKAKASSAMRGNQNAAAKPGETVGPNPGPNRSAEPPALTQDAEIEEEEKKKKDTGIRAADEAAKAMGVSGSYIESAKAVAKESPDLVADGKSGKVTVSQAQRQIKQDRIKKKAAEVKKAAPKGLRIYASMDELTWAVSGGEEKRFACIYADPPWSYDNQGTRGATDNQYVTMSIDDIKAMPVQDVAADDAHLLLWATSTLLPEALDTLKAWGFTYNSHFVWDKRPRFGLGNRFRICTELLLVGVRGKSADLWLDHGQPNIYQGDAGKHSAKPDAVREIVARCTTGPHVELFARQATKGWAVMGNEIEVPQEATA